ncbi:alpha/beta hydrolase [Rhizobium oryzicola]|uniref:Alpha/beta fold hydrolase n=1 Tax=Rhizobium oryzicola TaxID=1232668 RepID=A0ABT8SX81_9HYPH|nr:alpha/beta fold hydrolase [Rhizobium oryzicola]MDO1583030.1 alpha/beta fold hydrolase [Rhizobium oryzicola]
MLKPTAPAKVSAAGGKVQTIYVATTRMPSSANPGAFTSERSLQTHYAEYQISVPPNHKPGAIEWPTAARDPKTSFVTVSYRPLDRPAFERAVASRQNGAKPNVGVFVHGFNNNFQEALYRLAQMHADAGGRGSVILFSWPSEASIGGYVADKDGVTISRDGLVDVLTMLGRNPNLGNTIVLGHSMGGWLTAESLRQLRLMHRDDVFKRMKVVLAAPDIDVDVFRSQLEVIGPLNPPMTLLVSKDDKALAVSRFIAGEHNRLGALDVDHPQVAEAARKANVQVVDISALKTDDDFRHNRFTELAAMMPKLMERDKTASATSLQQAGAFVLNGVGTTLASPFRLAGAAMAGSR